MDHAAHHTPTPVVLVTGGSRGLGLAVVAALSADGWEVVTDARDAGRLDRAIGRLPGAERVTAVPGDIADAHHRRTLLAKIDALGGLDLLVNNAGGLGPSPLPEVRRLRPADLRELLDTNVVAPISLLADAVPLLAPRRGASVSITSDAAAEAYPGWGGYGASKAAVEHLTAVFAEEHPELAVYSFDPGDMATAMHQLAYPGEDISDRPSPESVVPALLTLVRERPASGRYRASDLLAGVSE